MKTYIATFIKSESSSILGYVLFEQKNPTCPVKVSFRLEGFTKVGVKHAIHIHEFGDMRSGCTSLGGHWNPEQTNHGSFLYQTPRHAGDLINNLQVQSGKIFYFDYDDYLLTLYGRNSILGRSVVIHYGIDDQGFGNDVSSLRTGNAGERLTCAVIGIASPEFS